MSMYHVIASHYRGFSIHCTMTRGREGGEGRGAERQERRERRVEGGEGKEGVSWSSTSLPQTPLDTGEGTHLALGGVIHCTCAQNVLINCMKERTYVRQTRQVDKCIVLF